MDIETARLLLCRPRLADVPDLFAFLGDAVAMRHTHVDRSIRQCRRRIAVHERRRRRDGYAPWVILTKSDSRIVGWGGLYQDPFTPGWGVEIGYSFHPSVWGQGYASELANTCIGLADGALALSDLRAFAHPANLGSRRVLEKAGFAMIGFVPSMERFLYLRVQHGIRPIARPDDGCETGGSYRWPEAVVMAGAWPGDLHHPGEESAALPGIDPPCRT
jgi:[ribosomal protein S5]-alanine N-acetyltransferase